MSIFGCDTIFDAAVIVIQELSICVIIFQVKVNGWPWGWMLRNQLDARCMISDLGRSCFHCVMLTYVKSDDVNVIVLNDWLRTLLRHSFCCYSVFQNYHVRLMALMLLCGR